MKIILFFVVLIIPLTSQAEVSDKMATQSGLWLSGFIAGALLAVFIRWSRWANIIGLPLIALFFYFAYDTLAQPDIGPAIIREQGAPYIVALYGSAVLVLVGLLVGNYLYKVKTVRNA